MSRYEEWVVVEPASPPAICPTPQHQNSGLEAPPNSPEIQPVRPAPRRQNSGWEAPPNSPEARPTDPTPLPSIDDAFLGVQMTLATMGMISTPPSGDASSNFDMTECEAGNLACPWQDRVIEDKRTNLSIGISGCTSSGKTLLSWLLKAIFTLDNGSSPTLVHQDSHFIPKNQCPETEFTTYHSDLDLVSLGIASGGFGSYYMKVNHPSSGDVGTYTFTGPDTDCDGAISYTTLWHQIRDVLRCTKEQTGRCEGTFCCGPMAGGSERSGGFAGGYAGVHLMPDIEEMGLGPLIKEMREKVAMVLKESDNEDLKMAIAEGFLLFQDPSLVIDGPAYDPGLYGDPEFDPEGSPEILKLSNLEMKAAIQPLLDIKLFLPISYSTAVTRRFCRPEYNHPGPGDEGNLWKTRGYYDAVAWKNYVDSYSWLIGHEGEEFKDINVGMEDGTIEENVRWAVEVILDKLLRD